MYSTIIGMKRFDLTRRVEIDTIQELKEKIRRDPTDPNYRKMWATLAHDYVKTHPDLFMEMVHTSELAFGEQLGHWPVTTLASLTVTAESDLDFLHRVADALKNPLVDAPATDILPGLNLFAIFKGTHPKESASLFSEMPYLRIIENSWKEAFDPSAGIDKEFVTYYGYMIETGASWPAHVVEEGRAIPLKWHIPLLPEESYGSGAWLTILPLVNPVVAEDTDFYPAMLSRIRDDAYSEFEFAIRHTRPFGNVHWSNIEPLLETFGLHC